jgi:hypothetical protein
MRPPKILPAQGQFFRASADQVLYAQFNSIPCCMMAVGTTFFLAIPDPVAMVKAHAEFQSLVSWEEEARAKSWGRRIAN